VIIDGSLSEQMVKNLIEDSYDLVVEPLAASSSPGARTDNERPTRLLAANRRKAAAATAQAQRDPKIPLVRAAMSVYSLRDEFDDEETIPG
jgi:hypothetical protein